jgi:hypothetical protein
LRAYLPLSNHGSIIVGTRNKAVALRMVEDNDIIGVEPMNEATALSLLRAKLGMQGRREDLIELAEALEHMPLAIVQAAAYIRQRSPRWSVQQYLRQFEGSHNQEPSLLG